MIAAELLDERLFGPMGVDHAERAAFGFHGLDLTTEGVAAFGELLRREGRWGDRRLIPRDWVWLVAVRQVARLRSSMRRSTGARFGRRPMW